MKLKKMKALSNIPVGDDFQARKTKVETAIKKILDKEGLGIQAIIQRTDTADTATLIFLDIRAIEESQKVEEDGDKEKEKDEETKSDEV